MSRVLCHQIHQQGSQTCLKHLILHESSYIVMSSISSVTCVNGTNNKDYTIKFGVFILPCSLGMDVDMFEGKSLIVYLVCEKGLAADWNTAHPESLDMSSNEEVTFFLLFSWKTWWSNTLPEFLGWCVQWIFEPIVSGCIRRFRYMGLSQ